MDALISFFFEKEVQAGSLLAFLCVLFIVIFKSAFSVSQFLAKNRVLNLSSNGEFPSSTINEIKLDLKRHDREIGDLKDETREIRYYLKGIEENTRFLKEDIRLTANYIAAINK